MSVRCQLSFHAKFLCSTLLLLVMQVWMAQVYEWLNEPLEHHVFKGQTLHNFWRSVGRDAHLPSASAKVPLIVFQHVPRTAGDAMRTHLFWDAQVDSSLPWPSGYPEHNESFLGEADFQMVYDNKIRLIKGFISNRDLERMEEILGRSERKMVRFVFLRHPIERILSLHALVQPKHVVRDSKGREQRQFYTAAGLVERGKVWPWACTFTRDAMTWQLGDQQHCGVRSNISGEEVLGKAKEAIENADFVGFYESLDTDFWRLKDEIFPHVVLARYVPYAFWIGTMLSVPRLRVLKFSQRLTAEELEDISKANKLDLELYDWALKTYNPDLVLYPSYAKFVLAHVPALVVMALLGAACCQLSWMLCASLCCPGEPVLPEDSEAAVKSN
mmetsp:Transcript_60266/g.132486  ORF Transcript_60266/g.132486 Transcript_60266/m.132486 type:complete len:386 (+) Transcript_60266:160-1317(+)